MVTTIIHAFVSSRLDSCNSLLYGLSDCQISKFQRVQNSAARIVSQCLKHDHMKLHWLPVRQRLQAMFFKNNMAPSYIGDLLTKFNPERELRSTSTNSLNVPPAGNAKYYNDRTFSIAAPIVWKNLPPHLRIMSPFNLLKKELKTHIFRSVYSELLD